jgi:hypothetical protein
MAAGKWAQRTLPSTGRYAPPVGVEKVKFKLIFGSFVLKITFAEN